MSIPPLSFKPLAVPKPWGGTRLARFGRELPSGEPIGETWEVSDYEGRRTKVASGPLAGLTLRDLARRFGKTLLGRTEPDHRGCYPLLLKLIDASARLSVQVHPSDETAAELGDENGGKEEAWLVLAAEPPGRLALGLAPAADPDEALALPSSDRMEELLNWRRVRPGEMVFIPPGTIHAVDAGVVLMEIQQTSDATYRIHDWERTGSRDLHIERAAAAMVPSSRPVPAAVDYAPDERAVAEGRRLSVSSLRVAGSANIEGSESVLVFCTGGDLTLRNEAGTARLSKFGVLFLPASPRGTRLEGEGTLLLMRERKK